MKILGIDIGSTNLGLAILDQEQLSLEKTVILPKISIGQKLKIIEKELDDLLLKFEVALISYEMPVIKGKNAFGLYYVCGICHLVAAKHNLPISSYYAKQVKKTITGTGNADKDLVETFVHQQFPNQVIQFSSDHASDAAAIALTHLRIMHNA